MKSLTYIGIFLIVASHAGVSFAQSRTEVWHCDAKNFNISDNSDGSNPDHVETSEFNATIFSTGTNTYSADFITTGVRDQNITDASVVLQAMSPETVGGPKFLAAIRYMAAITKQPKLAKAASYKSYQILTPKKNVYFAGLEFLDTSGKLLGKALLLPKMGDVISACFEGLEI